MRVGELCEGFVDEGIVEDEAASEEFAWDRESAFEGEFRFCSHEPSCDFQHRLEVGKPDRHADGVA